LSADALVVGPGAGRSPSATSVSMFERTTLPAVLALAKPVVLDADALNTIAYNESLQKVLAARRAPTILTPHPAEAARLLGNTTKDVQSDRHAAAAALAQRYRAHVVLKGAGSICAFPDERWSVNASGNAGLASGGTGDVLAGMIGALLSQGHDAERALQLAVCLHGAAADALAESGAGPAGLTASEVAIEARRLMNAWTAR
jgi:ADP-dependent NAD(P)H-hydrate dehydratase / NAD(P)H-hydrate epimerase